MNPVFRISFAIIGVVFLAAFPPVGVILIIVGAVAKKRGPSKADQQAAQFQYQVAYQAQLLEQRRKAALAP